MVKTKSAHSLRVPWLSPIRVGLGVLVIASVILSPVLVVYEFVLGLALALAGYVARLARPRSSAGNRIGIIGLALLAGPMAYLLAWPLAFWFDW
jgi:hypothetical protein